MAKLFTKDFKKAVLLKIAPRFLYVFLNLLYFTCRKKINTKILSKDLPSSVIVTFWHGELLALLKGYLLYRNSNKIDTLVSEHKDGEIIARVVTLYGGGSIRGSSTRGGIKALRQAFKSIELKRDIGITPDGPKGPRHSVADGIVLISQKKNVPIVTFNCKPSSFWQLNSWDKFVIPKPFCTLNFYIGEPFYLDGLSIDEAKELVKERLIKNAI